MFHMIKQEQDFIASVAADLEIHGTPSLTIKRVDLDRNYWVEGLGLNWAAIREATQNADVESQIDNDGSLVIWRLAR